MKGDKPQSPAYFVIAPSGKRFEWDGYDGWLAISKRANECGWFDWETDGKIDQVAFIPKSRKFHVVGFYRPNTQKWDFSMSDAFDWSNINFATKEEVERYLKLRSFE